MKVDKSLNAEGDSKESKCKKEVLRSKPLRIKLEKKGKMKKVKSQAERSLTANPRGKITNAKRD